MSRIHLLLLIGVNALWGFNFIAGKEGTTSFGPLLFIALRFIIVLLLLLPFIRWVPGQMRRIISIGICLGLFHYGFMFYGLHLAGSLSSVAIAAQLTVPFVTILAVIFLGERIGPTRIFAITVSFVGVALIGFEPTDPEHLLALLLTTIASAAMAVATILIRQLDNVSVFNLQAWIAVCATIGLTAATAIFEKPDLAAIASLPIKSYWAPFYSAVGATIIGHGLLYALLKIYPVNSVAPFITLSTLFAILFGVVLLNDTLTLKIILGGLMTLLGVTVVAIRNSKENTPSGIRSPH